MTHPHDSGEHVNGPDQIGELMKLAGRRPMPDPSQMSRARAAAHREWTRVVGRRHWSLWTMAGAALAAGVVGAVAWALLRQTPPQATGAEIATVQTVTRSVVIASAGEAPRAIETAGARIRAGDRLETADGRAALLIRGGLSVRLDRSTAAVLASVTRLVLAHGTVYIDAEPGTGAPGLQVETTFGVVRHVGTQFEVRLDAASLRVRVREGSVAVERSGERWTSEAGEALLFMRGRSPERQVVGAAGPEWSWVAGLARPFHLEGAKASAFLDWVSREQGWRVQYDDPSLGPRVERTVLRGSIEGFTPEEALAAVLPACGLTSRRDGDRLIVSAARSK